MHESHDTNRGRERGKFTIWEHLDCTFQVNLWMWGNLFRESAQHERNKVHKCVRHCVVFSVAKWLKWLGSSHSAYRPPVLSFVRFVISPYAIAFSRFSTPVPNAEMFRAPIVHKALNYVKPIGVGCPWHFGHETFGVGLNCTLTLLHSGSEHTLLNLLGFALRLGQWNELFAVWTAGRLIMPEQPAWSDSLRVMHQGFVVVDDVALIRILDLFAWPLLLIRHGTVISLKVSQRKLFFEISVLRTLSPWKHKIAYIL